MKIFLKILKLSLPFILGIGILWWMYRGNNWTDFFHILTDEMHWGWMLTSFIFGILAQQVRAWRWRMALSPIGEHPRRRSCEDAIFISYATSLVVPRIGEVMRCGAIKRSDGVSFSKSLGTVITERIIDSLVMLILTALALLMQIPVFIKFVHTTGLDLGSFLRGFTTTGYLVTLICLLAIVGTGFYLIRTRFSRFCDFWQNLKSGLLSLRKVKNLPLYITLSFSINLCYFLHFYLAFFCFDFTSHFGSAAAFLIFCVGSFAVLVPNPNGAGPWHFAVKTMLVLYGVAEVDAINFALVVHTVQTGLVILLGVVGALGLNLRKKINTQ